MSTVRKNSTYVDTNVSGLVVQISHNMNGTAYPSIYELDGGAKVFLSLFDPRIAEVKDLDDDTTQVTFASAFAGYIDLVVFDVSVPSAEDRVKSLEDKYNDLLAMFNKYVTKSTSTQMNNYFDSKIKDLEAKDEDLQTQINTLRTDVDAL